jgi:ribonuclease HII
MNQIVPFYNLENKDLFEIGIDEAGRGPLFGRLYVAAVVLPKDGSFDFTHIKDSKKITSAKKRQELYNRILQTALATHIHFIEADTIDKINIRQAVLKGMRECISEITKSLQNKMKVSPLDRFIMVDGNDFPPYMEYQTDTEKLKQVPTETFIGGDNIYANIAAASILAKVARDNYILDLCKEHSYLGERYGLHKNMGYGTKQHMEGIQKYGITPWHRKSYGCCKTACLADVSK